MSGLHSKPKSFIESRSSRQLDFKNPPAVWTLPHLDTSCCSYAPASAEQDFLPLSPAAAAPPYHHHHHHAHHHPSPPSAWSRPMPAAPVLATSSQRSPKASKGRRQKLPRRQKSNTYTRIRVDPHQTKILENFFQSTSHPDKEARDSLSRQINLPERNIQIWFQNRRAKARHEHANEVPLFSPFPLAVIPTPSSSCPPTNLVPFSPIHSSSLPPAFQDHTEQQTLDTVSSTLQPGTPNPSPLPSPITPFLSDPAFASPSDKPNLPTDHVTQYFDPGASEVDLYYTDPCVRLVEDPVRLGDDVAWLAEFC